MYPQPIGLPRFLLTSVSLVILVSLLSSCAEDRPLTLEERAQSVDKRLICPYCPAETIDQAQVPQAREMRAFVREKLAEGWTEQQILDYFSAPERYGLRVLAEPPKSGSTLTIWLLPPAVFLLAGGILFFVLRSMKRGDPSALDDPPPDLPQSDGNEMDEYLERVDAEIASRSSRLPPSPLMGEGKDGGDPSHPHSREGGNPSSPFPLDGGRLGWGCSPSTPPPDPTGEPPPTKGKRNG